MKLRPFELALIIIFGGLAILALILLRMGPIGNNEEQVQIVGSVTIWGTIPSAAVDSVLFELSEANKDYYNVKYKYISPERFDVELVNAIADDAGPDLILVSHEKLVDMRKRIQAFSYESFPPRDIRNRYVDGALIYGLDDGFYGYPIAVDPLMMYWNRDILATEGYLSPPKTWEELVNTMFDDLIKREYDRTITRGVVAMGEYGNVRNAFGVISALLLQGGTLGVSAEENGKYYVKLQMSEDGKSNPLKSAADFYTRFSKPSNVLYSWNRSFEEDRLEFIAENLALYFGYGSEARYIEKVNPNLNFDISEIPQGASATVRRTYGKVYALSMLKTAGNPYGASAVLTSLGSYENSIKIANAANMAPAFRTAVAQGSNDTYGRVVYQSAAVSLGWLNPTMADADYIFETMTKDINENRRELSLAASDAAARLGSEY